MATINLNDETLTGPTGIDAMQRRKDFSRKELLELQKAFEIFDEDESGCLDHAECENLMTALGRNPSKEELAQLFERFDADASGTVSFDEFVELMKYKVRQPFSREQVYEAVEALDHEGNGYVSTERLRVLLTTRGERRMADDEVTAFLAAVTASQGDIKDRVFLQNIRRVLLPLE
jgi:Ca2+-binding EF-hand superfamily protein